MPLKCQDFVAFPNTADNFPIPKHLVNLIFTYHSQELWKLTHQVWCLLSMHGWVMTVSRLPSDLDTGACIFQENMPIEIFNVSLESTQHKQ